MIECEESLTICTSTSRQEWKKYVCLACYSFSYNKWNVQNQTKVSKKKRYNEWDYNGYLCSIPQVHAKLFIKGVTSHANINKILE